MCAMPLSTLVADNSQILLSREDFDDLSRAYLISNPACKKNGAAALAASGNGYASGFLALWASVRGHTMLDPFRGLTLVMFADYAASLPGPAIECGSARCGSGVLLALRLRAVDASRAIYLADSFDGLPMPDRRYDRAYEEGDFRVDQERVHAFMVSMGLQSDCVLLHGRFEQTLRSLPAAFRPALVHLDADLYHSTAYAFAELYPRACIGAPFVFDDFYDESGGVRSALWPHIVKSGELLILGPTGQCAILKGFLGKASGHTDLVPTSTSLLRALPGYAALLEELLAVQKNDIDRIALRQLLELARPM
jgi:hypothetical protein